MLETEGCMAVQAGNLLENSNFENSNVSVWLVEGEKRAEHAPVSMVTISSLSVADSPRISGENQEHVQLLAETGANLPPIIVHRPTMRVIDGIHRLRAARLRGDEQIAVRFFSGAEDDAFVVAVKSNIAHGLPLSFADREAAAVRIIASHPHWSDRMIASVTGLAPKTVVETRKRHATGSEEVVARIGRDGRVRPVDYVAGRLLAAELIAEDPNLSLRQIAHAAGISPETARDVRNRMRRGEEPVPERRQKGRARQPAQADHPDTADSTRVRPAGISSEIRVGAMERLKRDPALRFTEMGRTLLRMLSIHVVEADEWAKIADNVPQHCSGIIAQMARECAEMWVGLAEQVSRKATDIT
jgi:ParB-like chromosome segregation protein Spo0J